MNVMPARQLDKLAIRVTIFAALNNAFARIFVARALGARTFIARLRTWADLALARLARLARHLAELRCERAKLRDLRFPSGTLRAKPRDLSVARLSDFADQLRNVFADVNLISHLSLSARRVWVVEDL